MQAIVAFLVGALFAVGLGISGMTQPSKVIGFLDVFGPWDLSLMFVMVGAVAVFTLFFRVLRGTAPLLADKFHLPLTSSVDGRLIAGSVLFGVGWGLAGYCPGPALTSLATASRDPLIFVAAMLAGMALFTAFDLAWKAPRKGAPHADPSLLR